MKSGCPIRREREHLLLKPNQRMADPLHPDTTILAGFSRPGSRRAFLAFLAGSPLAAAWSQSAGGTDEGAWSLWAEIMDHLQNNYYDKIDEGGLTDSAIALLIGKYPDTARFRPESTGGTAAQNRQAMREFILKAASLAGSRPGTASRLIEEAAELVCEKKLKFCHYIPATVLNRLQTIGKGGIGSVVQRGSDNRYLVFPTPGSEVALKGIRPGDELVSVDEVATVDMSPFRLKPRLYGSIGSKIVLGVKQKSGRTVTVTLNRQLYDGAKLRLLQEAGGPRICIPEFTESMVDSLSSALKQVRPDDTLVIDLRGNGGGPVDLAVAAAGLLLPGSRPAPLVLKRERGKSDTTLTTNRPGENPAKRIIVLLDGGSASSSEILAAALMDCPELKVSIGGSRSYGKDLWQIESVMTNGGGCLTTTTGSYTRLNRQGWHEGIAPTMGTL